MISFLKKHVWLFILIFSLVLIPGSISAQSELNSRILITGIAIDEAENGFEITAQTVMPTSGNKAGGNVATLNFVSATGTTIDEAVEILSSKIGKTSGVSHMTFALVGEDVYKNANLLSKLDFFIRDERVLNSMAIFCTEGKAKNQIIKTQNLEISAGIGIRNTFMNKQSSLSGVVTPYVMFMNKQYTKSATDIVSGLSIVEEEIQSDLGSGGGAATSSSQIKTGRIVGYNDIYCFKKGLFVQKITDKKQKLGVHLMLKESKEGPIPIENVTDEFMTNAKLDIYVRNKKSKVSCKFVDGKPQVKIKVSFNNIKVREIDSETTPLDNYLSFKTYTDNPKVKEALTNEVKNAITAVFEATKNNCDIFQFEDSFYRHCTKQYKEYKQNNGNNLLSDISLEIEVDIKDRT